MVIPRDHVGDPNLGVGVLLAPRVMLNGLDFRDVANHPIMHNITKITLPECSSQDTWFWAKITQGQLGSSICV